MNGSLAQLIALTSYGNAFLTSWETDNGFYPGNALVNFDNKAFIPVAIARIFQKLIADFT
jgi:hypothetical protein